MNATSLLFVVLVAVAMAAPEQKYTDKYDNIDLNQIVDNRNLLIPYIKCVLDKGRCTAQGRELKSHIKEALETYCDKCTDAQKRGTRLVIAHLINYEPGYWNELTQKFDPTRKYVTKYEQELRTVQG